MNMIVGSFSIDACTRDALLAITFSEFMTQVEREHQAITFFTYEEMIDKLTELFYDYRSEAKLQSDEQPEALAALLFHLLVFFRKSDFDLYDLSRALNQHGVEHA